jgi:hemerythrin-like domain-containing protein
MITINAPLEHTLDQPIGLLGDCHRRIERFLDQLIRVTEVIGSGPLTPEARRALEQSLQYFREAAPVHTQDEEESLFPRLRQLAQGRDESAEKAKHALSIVERLQADHEVADKRHLAIDEIGRRWLEKSTLSAEEVQRLQDELKDLRAFYTAHLAAEDGELFPLSETILDENQLAEMGREMAARRKEKFRAGQ